jgi:hypothetical protein
MNQPVTWGGRLPSVPAPPHNRRLPLATPRQIAAAQGADKLRRIVR